MNNPYSLTVNIDWYETTEDEDIKYIIRHEARHIYQWHQVLKYKNGKSIEEKPALVKQWSDNLLSGNYIYNTPSTEKQHFLQPCEIDAYAFATFLAAIESFNPKDGSFSVPYFEYPGIGETIYKQALQEMEALSVSTIENIKRAISV